MSSPNAAPVELTPVLNPDADALDALELKATNCDGQSKDQIQSCLAAIADEMGKARAIWQDYADNPAESEVRFTPVMRIGAERARALHQIHLALRAQAKSLTDASGVSFRDTIGISPQVDIIEAYAQLGDDETGAARAAAALATMAQRIERINAVRSRFQ